VVQVLVQVLVLALAVAPGCTPRFVRGSLVIRRCSFVLACWSGYLPSILTSAKARHIDCKL